ncbi:protein CHUP1, chloroplastic-like isoform X2 [Abrus precatorius]|uniref:Protein CHUP1, chloroplastic-like isoform X2 n=1 Tax=Abrus precatorius TaxID=3816 RepID=A0A8B8JY48_ABRPR|nr:protein CHUP1, chloroplastic-like isoform X2 [Abrus precatorius]
MKESIAKRFLIVIAREDKGMKPILLKCGLALALTFAGFLYSHIRTKRIKPSPTSPRRHASGRRAASSSCSTVADENFLEAEETCITKVITKNSPVGLSPSTKQSADKDEYLLPECNDSPLAYSTSLEKDDYEQEIRKLRSMIRMLQERERSLEVQLLEYCGLREQEAAVMELQNRLKISSMEAKMFNLKVVTLQSENRRLVAQVADHAKVLSELEAAKTKVKFLKKKIRYEAEQNREHIMNLKQKVAKLQDHECKAAASDQDIQMKIKRLKDLESESEQLRKSNLRLQMDNSDLARRLDSTQILANAVLEDPDASALKEEGERLRQENGGLMKEVEQLHADRCQDLEELVYLRWINACLRHELRNYQPPHGKTAARDLSKSLSPTSEKKAKQLILEYANTEGGGSVSDLDSDQWSSSQASFLTDSGECEEYSPLDNPSSDTKVNNTSKSKIFGKLMKLIRGKESQHQRGRVTSQEKSISREDINSSNFSLSISTGTESLRSEYATPTAASSASYDFRTMCLKDENGRNSDSHTPKRSKIFGVRKTGSGDFKNRLDSFSESAAAEKSNLVKYAEALRDSSGSTKHKVRRRSASYSSF